MTEKKKPKEEGKSVHLDVLIPVELKKAIDEYCSENLESITETITNAIKRYIGFPKGNKPKAMSSQIEKDESDTIHLNIRIHPRLKKSLKEYCEKKDENVTDIVIIAVRDYIGYFKR